MIEAVDNKRIKEKRKLKEKRDYLANKVLLYKK